MLARSSAASGSARLLLLALLACAAATAAWGGSICDTANCGKGNCTEVPGLISTYQCDCDPGWSRVFKLIPFSPCTIPNCSFDSACLNLTLTPPKGIPTDICAAVTCGPGGACKKGDGGVFAYSCECQPGYANLLNLTALPCVNNCVFGKDCSALGLGPPLSPAPASPPPSTAPPGNQDSSGPSAPPSGTKGSVPSQSLLVLSLLVSVAMVQLVYSQR